ncbi:nucleotide exchange factor GrpE [Macrococcoides caseolyticum]|uniref:nucleotide exchange factor GrpE n=1 Tax=Macrococcoides caseolyticum TaxID=69966 RepID=UPI001F20B3A4|nr:nucleotide exchange factor GrpE [Macrococcus caseolyticus]MCE4956160.1 nucleotide exchange factor GrpE [Macrococcus caseolyticus]
MSETNEDKKVESVNETNETVEKDVTDEIVPEAPIEAIEQEEEIDELTETKNALNAAEEKYLRLYAEFENYKKRTRAELDTERTYRSQNVLRDILPTLDNIERALAQKGESEEFKSLHKGVEMVYESLLNSLKENGLEVIDAIDQPFDPNYHQAVMQESDPDKSSGIVLEELQKGYKLKERVLRASMVKVNE